MRTLCFTIDFDRDVNDPIPGKPEAISLDRGQGNEPRFSSSGKGAEIILNLLDDLGIKATFFAEARTLRATGIGRSISGHEVGFHGIDHEDFTGARTGVNLDHGEMREIVERGFCMIRDDVGRSPRGFRSPYMDPNDDMLEFLREYGVVYDASKYVYVKPDTDIYRDESGLWEVPAVKGKDSEDRTVTSYLWPMHEGKRTPQDFVKLGEQICSGTFVLATHTWHMAETRGGGVMDDAQVSANYDNVREAISFLLDSGFRAKTVESAVGSI